MTKLNTILAAVAAALFMSGGAMAASLQPAAGEAPFFNEAPVSTSTVTRSAVEAQASAARPAAGNLPITSRVAANDPASTLTRAEVRAQAAAFHPAAGQMSAGSGLNGQAQVQNQASAQVLPNAS